MTQTCTPKKPLLDAVESNPTFSWQTIDKCYRPRAVSVAYSLVRHVWPERTDEAEDIANEALEKASACIDQHDGVRPLWPWVRRIVHTTAIDRLRRFSGILLGDADGEVLASMP